MSQRSEFIQGLRDMADFLESQPGLPVPLGGNDVFIWERSLSRAKDRATQMAPCEKKYSEGYFELVRHFGPHTVTVIWRREDICERVQVGTKHVPAYVVEAHDEPVYEWDCTQKPLLGSSDKELSKGE